MVGFDQTSCWVFVSLKPVYTYSPTVYVRIRAALHYAESSIQMLWCADRDECYDICNLDEVTKVVFLKCFGSTFSVIMSHTTNKTKNFQLSVCHSPQSTLTLFYIVWHFCATNQYDDEKTRWMRVYLELPDPALQALFYIRSERDFNCITFYFHKLVNSLKSKPSSFKLILSTHSLFFLQEMIATDSHRALITSHLTSLENPKQCCFWIEQMHFAALPRRLS